MVGTYTCLLKRLPIYDRKPASHTFDTSHHIARAVGIGGTTLTSPLLEVLCDDVLASNFSCIELTAVVVDRALEASIEVSITPAVISLDDKIAEVLPESRYHLLRLTIERKKLTRT